MAMIRSIVGTWSRPHWSHQSDRILQGLLAILLASGGTDKIVRLWPISSQPATIAPTEMETKRYESAICSENSRLFSRGAADGKIFIHDVSKRDGVTFIK